jgi:Cu(I)/Ag(I) efflux system periplasmic protein CusF
MNIAKQEHHYSRPLLVHDSKGINMKTTIQIAQIWVATIGISFSLSACAQSEAPTARLSDAVMQPATTTEPAITSTTTSPTQAKPVTSPADGEVRKIDIENLKITIKHGEIKNLDMPSMTMVFQIKEATLIKDVKVGDKIKFAAEKQGRDYVVTEVQVVK